MKYSSDLYLHDMDKTGMNLLNKLPEWKKLESLFELQNIEEQNRLELLSSAVLLGENQMPDIYKLLAPICDRLDIPIPELYCISSKCMNAYTVGVVSPMVVISSKLVECMSLDSLRVVLAHECGHIACKHTYYATVKNWIAHSVENSKVLKKFVTKPLQDALMFWSRCSELSADRACLLCEEGYESTVNTLLSCNGFDEKVNRDAFINQSIEMGEKMDCSVFKQFLYDSMCKKDSHPRLSIRVFECYKWVCSDQYKGILNGTYCVEDSKKVEEAIFKSEILLNADHTIDVDRELERINKELVRYTSEADFADYAFSMSAGVMAGVIDAFFVGKMEISDGDVVISHPQMNDFIQWFARKNGYSGERLSGAIRKLEKSYGVLQDDVWSGLGIGVGPKNHHLADFAHHPTPIGLISAIIVQYLRVGTFVNKNGDWHFVFLDSSLDGLKQIMIPAILTGSLNWIVDMLENQFVSEEFKEACPKEYKFFHRASKGAAFSPVLIELVQCTNNWFGHLVSDMGGSHSTAGGGMGIPGVFVSFLHELSSIPIFKKSGFSKFVNDLYVKEKFDLRNELGMYKSLGLQAIPVIFMEVYIRLSYFLIHLCMEDLDGDVNWSRVLPFNNRTVDQMLEVANLTFTVADTTDAAVHAALESSGDWMMFARSFAVRFNYIGAGRTVVSVVKEFSNESKEEQLLHEKLILMHAKSLDMIKKFEKYKADLDGLLSSYIGNNIQTFFEGFDCIEGGLLSNDSNLVIQGNVMIQESLGRDVQFSNQDEFDGLMNSDDDFIF